LILRSHPDLVEWINHALHRLQAQLLAQELKKRYENASLCHTALFAPRVQKRLILSAVFAPSWTGQIASLPAGHPFHASIAITVLICRNISAK
jgi:hypothetical protein